ncbi:MAG: lytic murein transglycosylase [Halofilum sp. (in: g-proteobacteria)]
MIAPRQLFRAVLCLLPLAGSAQAATVDAFSACVSGLRDEAARQDISTAVIDESLTDVERVERVVELDRSQPEFTTPFSEYLERRVTDTRVEKGRELLERHEDLLQDIYRDYGVPPRYLVAFWGMETNFGSHFGGVRTLDALATLACDDRRSGYFTEQLVAALRIVDEGAIPAERMEGSWAGALGHIQFMPSVFAEYAVDYDDDGRRDLWNSVPDAMASAANFLRGIGWERGWRWGREVTLPDDFPYEMSGHENPRSMDDWKDLGVRTAHDRTVPGGDAKAALIVPSGHEGPKFLVYENFKVIMRWNQSEFYALSVGHLADRLAGSSGLTNPPPGNAPRLTRDDVIALQERLNENGFDAGAADGIPGTQTRAAIRKFQQEQDMIADGFVSREVLERLSLQVAERLAE